jgi:hypothetical protein
LYYQVDTIVEADFKEVSVVDAVVAKDLQSNKTNAKETAKAKSLSNGNETNVIGHHRFSH